MIYYSDSDIVIRDMKNSDVSLMAIPEMKQGGQMVLEKYYSRLEDQDKCKNIALVAEYKGFIAGYVNIYPFSLNGVFKGNGFSEIVGLMVFDEYKNLGFEKKLMDVAENIASDYSGTVYTSVDVKDWQALDFFLKRGFIPHQSGVWNKREVYHSVVFEEDDKFEDKLVLWLSKKIEFPIIHTFERQYLRLWESGLKKVDGRVNDAKYKQVNVKDEVVLCRNDNDFIKGVVTFRHEYSTIEEMLRLEGVKNMLPFLDDSDIEKGVRIYQEFPGWERVVKYGCVAFGIKIIES